MPFIYLSLAIVAEVIATSALKASNGFTSLAPSTFVIIGYGASFYFLSLVLKVMPVGIAYAIWAGMGIVLVSLVAAVWLKQLPDLPAIVGMVLIVIGVVVINVFSKTTAH